MNTKTPKETLQKVEGIVRDALEEQFGDGLVFDPIIVTPMIDPWDDERLHVYIVVDGDLERLDPSWTLGLVDIILKQVTEEEVPNVPLKSFIQKSEWEEYLREPEHRWIPTT